MTKRKISVLAVMMCLLLVISMVCACNLIPNEENNNTTTKYNLTVQDPNGYLIEELQAQYQAGEEVIVKTRELADENLMAYLDDELLGLETKVYYKGEYHWEYFFTMPARDATLSFKFSDGLTHKGIALDEDVQQKIITSFVNAYSTDRDPITADEISLRCYGAFDGVYVLFVDVESMLKLPAFREQTIAGVKFIYSYLQTMVVYSNNAFYEIKDAYENNILSYDNMLAAQQTYKACHMSLYIA